MTNSRIGPWRWFAKFAQAAVLLGLPFLVVGDESALRFDVPSLTLFFFGRALAIDEFFILLAATLFVVFLIALVTILFGRIWCGWICPQTVIGDLIQLVSRPFGRGSAGSAGFLAATLVISVIIGASLVWYFVSPYDFFRRLLQGTLGPILWGFWISLSAILFLNFSFLGTRFCKTVCPYAKMQGSLYDNGTLVIAYDGRRADECINCRSCLRACPAGIDIRDGLSAACINCAKCIDVCRDMLEPKGVEGLIGYFFGGPGETAKLLRQNVLLIGSVAAVSFVFLLALAVGRKTLDMTVLPNHSFPPRSSVAGVVVNSYILALRNRGNRDLSITLRIEAPGRTFLVIPSSVPLDAGGEMKVPIVISGRLPGGEKLAEAVVVAEAAGVVARKRLFLRGGSS